MTVVKTKKQEAQENNYENCLEATQLENKINYLERKEIILEK